MSNEATKIYKEGSVVVQFGKISQDNNTREPIEWYVIKSTGTRIKLLSKRIIDVRQFDRAGCTEWCLSNIYEKLNGEVWFCNLNDAERLTIQPVFICEQDQSTNRTSHDSCSITLLTKEEAEQLPLTLRQTTFTNYALSKLGAHNIKDVPLDQLKWWTRSVNDESRVSVVSLNGEVLKSRMPSNEILGVRPVIWIDLMDAILNREVNISVTKTTTAKAANNDFNYLDLL